MRFALTLGSLTPLAMAGCITARPPAGEGLHGPVKEVQAEFDRHVRTQFPIGSASSTTYERLEATEKY